MPTIIDVAKESGVSKSTVSRVITGKGYVSEESTKKVFEAMEKLGYVPNLLARHLKSGHTKTIGFIAHSYISAMGMFLENFITIAKEYGYFVHLYLTNGDKKKEIEALNLMKYKQIDGVFILTRSNEWNVIKSYAKYGPISTWHRIDSPDIYSSYYDHYVGYLKVLNYLKEQGYERIGHVFGNEHNLNTQARQKAMTNFYKENNLELIDDWVILSDSLYVDGKVIADKWEKNITSVDVITFYSDYIAAQFLSQIQLKGYSSPENVGIMGFDNSDISELMHISTVDYSINTQAFNSFAYLYNQLNDSQLETKEIKAKLIERRTTSN